MKTKTKKQQTKKKIEQAKKKTVLAVVPKKENNFKPGIIRRWGLIVIISIAVAIQLGYNFTQTGSVLGQVTNITPSGLLLATNDQRAEANVAKLSLNDSLSNAAGQKAKDMFEHQYWAHTSPEGVDPWYWVKKTGYKYEEAGENLAKNFTTAEGTVAGWMGSESHKKNMLKPGYTDVGFAIADGILNGEQTTIVVALYAKPFVAPVISGDSGPFTAIAKTEAANIGGEPLSLASRMGVAIQSLTPAAMTSLALLFIAATIAIVSHAIRRTLPKRYRKKWYREHGAAKASLILLLAGLIILLYGGGSL